MTRTIEEIQKEVQDNLKKKEAKKKARKDRLQAVADKRREILGDESLEVPARQQKEDLFSMYMEGGGDLEEFDDEFPNLLATKIATESAVVPERSAVRRIGL